MITLVICLFSGVLAIGQSDQLRQKNFNIKNKSSPEMYEPAFGGWCAYAMGSSGEKVKIDPETFKIVDRKLYLFYNFWRNNTLTDWNKQEAYLKAKAEEHWKRFVP